MTLSTSNITDCFLDSNIELYYETIEDTVYLDDCDGLIKEVLDIFVEPKILKQYIFRAPIIENGCLTYGYRLKLIMVSTTTIEFTEESSQGQTKVISNDTLFNVTINLPETYEDGKTVNIEPSLIDVSSRLINKRTLYISTYFKFTILL